ncbi:MAG: pectate lyase [Mediterranea sp.]|jgi:pectinesterase|nr:pectate lyase [Mediterranea sp.]
MKKLSCIGLCLALILTANAQEVSYKNRQPYKSWTGLVRTFDDGFYQTKEAKRIADNVLLYQQTTGGWPKNIYIPAELDKRERKEVAARKNDVNESTIDNGATSTEIYYLARMYQATQDERYRKGAEDGIQYLLNAQYPNGGWPQFWPRSEGYYTEITYNDNAMVNVMKLLRSIYEKQPPYSFVADQYITKARAAFDKGVDCILKTQVRQNGKLTVWCAQHDHVTLEPIKARSYELPSLSGSESIGIVLLLLSLPDPSPAVVTAVESAVAWFEASKIEGLKREYYTTDDGKRDYRMAACAGCPPLWARFYDLATNQPFFCDRDGIKVPTLDQIGHERRNGYSWYTHDGQKVLEEYGKWKRQATVE